MANETVEPGPADVVIEALARLDRVIQQLDFMSSGLQAERRELFRLLMQLKNRNA